MSAARRRVNPLTGIWVRVHRLQQVGGLSRDAAEDVLRILVHQVSGQESTRKLTPAQRTDVESELDARIRRVERDRARQQAREAEGPTDVGLDGRAIGAPDSDATITPEQNRTLVALARAIGWGLPQLRSFCASSRMATVMGGRVWPQTRGEARAIHEALEAMLLRRTESQPAEVLRRAEAAAALPDLTKWERDFLADLIRRGKTVLARSPAKDGIWGRKPNTRRWRLAWKPLLKLMEIEEKRESQANEGPEPPRAS